MKKQTIIYCLLFLCLFIPIQLSSAPLKESVERVKDQNLELTSAKDFHITASVSAIENGSVNLLSEKAWLFFDNISPQQVLNEYKEYIKIYGSPLENGVNARVAIYAQGTVVMPENSDFRPLSVFSEPNFGGTALNCELNYYYKSNNAQNYLSKPLNEMDNQVRSFKLKRGYMATFATNAEGTDYSRVFIADKEDMEIPILQKELDKSISFIRVFKWEWVTKKGWCGTGAGSLDDAMKTRSTWEYSWSADLLSIPSVEWVPMRHNKSWPAWGEINAVSGSSHLLGFNEPDRSDQAEMTVEEAIAQWPDMMKTGLRLGSPCPSDPWNGNNWLFRFIDKCDELDYRVDYVVVHTYWANKSPQKWYDDLKAIHQRTKRPLWITEWNNGANWTSESWPSDWDAQQAKQLNDLKGILQVLDTASFIERYSIYNWVEDKRAIILNGQLTPAGEYYAQNNSVMAYDANNEFIPGWRAKTPNLRNLTVNKNGEVVLSWSDPNGSLSEGFLVERQYEGEEFKKIAQIDDNTIQTYTDLEKNAIKGYVKYRITSLLNTGDLSSNVISYYVAKGDKEQYGVLNPSNTDWITCRFDNTSMQNPTVIFGIASYNNGSGVPFATSVNSLETESFQFRINPWVYLNNPSLSKEESIPFFVLNQGQYTWGSVACETNIISNVNGVWKPVVFEKPFDVVPVVFATQITNRSQLPLIARIRNVSTTGFEVMLQKEEGQTKVLARENVSYLAVTPGIGDYAGQKIIVGKTVDNVVGGFYKSHKITFGESFIQPVLFASMQTMNDDITSIIRYNRITSDDAVIFKSREASLSNTQTNIAEETVGWIVLETSSSGTDIEPSLVAKNISVYPNPVANILYLNGKESQFSEVKIFNMQGGLAIQTFAENSIDVSALPKGLYIIVVDGYKACRFMKK